MESKSIPQGYRLRVGVRGGGGCGGATFVLGFDTKKESDLEYRFNGIPVVIDKRHTLYLIGKEVDYVSNGDAQGFTFVNGPGERDGSADSLLAHQ
jgi:iron-sulfur cluster assembly protein